MPSLGRFQRQRSCNMYGISMADSGNTQNTPASTAYLCAVCPFACERAPETVRLPNCTPLRQRESFLSLGTRDPAALWRQRNHDRHGARCSLPDLDLSLTGRRHRHHPPSPRRPLHLLLCHHQPLSPRQRRSSLLCPPLLPPPG